jgi:hypothetical protein
MAMKTVSQAEQALTELAERFTHWRQSRANIHERIPVPLWDQAVALSQVLPNGQVAKALRLSATDLKNRRLAQQASVPTQAPAESDPQFIDMTPAGAGWSAGPSATQVELERPDGLRMRIRCGAGSAELGELVRVFVEGERCFN